MKSFKTIALTLVTAGVFALTAKAVQINGSINFSGSVALDGDVNTATMVDFGLANSTTTTGTYNVVPFGTAVTFNDFTFAPFASPVPNLWSLTIAGPVSFAMTANTLTTLDRNPGDPLGSIELRGAGIASGTGYDNTPGVWIVTLNTADNGATFSFSASSAAAPVPEGGYSLIFLGTAISVIGLIRRKLLG